MDASVIIAILALLGSVITAYLSYRRDKNKLDTDAVNNLIQRALELNKQELEGIRLINSDLREQLEAEIKARQLAEKELFEAKLKIVALEKEIKEQKELYNSLAKRLETCESKLGDK